MVLLIGHGERIRLTHYHLLNIGSRSYNGSDNRSDNGSDICSYNGSDNCSHNGSDNRSYDVSDNRSHKGSCNRSHNGSDFSSRNGSESPHASCVGSTITMDCKYTDKSAVDQKGGCENFYEVGRESSYNCIERKVSCFPTLRRKSKGPCTRGTKCHPPSTGHQFSNPGLSDDSLGSSNSTNTSTFPGTDRVGWHELKKSSWEFKALKDVVEKSYKTHLTRDRKVDLAERFHVTYIARISEPAQRERYSQYKSKLERELRNWTFFTLDDKKQALQPWVDHQGDDNIPNMGHKALLEKRENWKNKHNQWKTEWETFNKMNPLRRAWAEHKEGTKPSDEPPDVLPNVTLKPRWGATKNGSLHFIESNDRGEDYRGICRNQRLPLTVKLLADATRGISETELSDAGLKLDSAINEVLLFHGTDATRVGSVADQGLKLGFGNGGLFGGGLYFCESISKSDEYAADVRHRDENRTEIIESIHGGKKPKSKGRAWKRLFGWLGSKLPSQLASNVGQGAFVTFIVKVALGNVFYCPDEIPWFRGKSNDRCRDSLLRNRCHSVLGDRERAKGQSYREFMVYEEEAHLLSWFVVYKRDYTVQT